MRLQFHKHFEKQYKKLRKGEQQRAKERLILFFQDEFNPILDNHPLQGRYKGYRSIDITGNLRAIYKRASTDIRIFIAVGTHPQLYD